MLGRRCWGGILGTLVLVACGDVSRGYGDGVSGDPDSEESQAIKNFYYAIYIDDNLSKAKQFASQRLDRLLDHYATVSGAERYVLGNKFSQVEIIVKSDSIEPYLYDSKERRVTVVFDGEYQGDIVKDRRDVVLVQEQGEWRVDQILDPRYRP